MKTTLHYSMKEYRCSWLNDSKWKAHPSGKERYSHVPELMGDGEGSAQAVLFTNGAAPQGITQGA